MGFPLYLELYDGKYKTGLQASFGGLYDVSRDGTYYLMSEASISLHNAESAVVLGGGVRFSGGRNNSQAVRWKDDFNQKVEDVSKTVKAKSIDDSESYEPEEK